MAWDGEAEVKHRATREMAERDGLEERRIEAAIGGGIRERRENAEAEAGGLALGRGRGSRTLVVKM